MAAGPTMDPAVWLNKQLEQASPDLLRQMLATFVAQVMGVEVDAICGAGYGERSPDRVNSRNDYRVVERATSGCQRAATGTRRPSMCRHSGHANPLVCCWPPRQTSRGRLPWVCHA